MIAVYAGSFDPFTVGHYGVYKQAKDIFEDVIVLFANNPMKQKRFNSDKMQNILYHRFGTHVDYCDGLVADYCREKNIEFLIRGIRSTSDYLYEENVAKINKKINTGLKTIYFRAEDDVISSSMVYELYKYGKDVSEFLPYKIEEVI